MSGRSSKSCYLLTAAETETDILLSSTTDGLFYKAQRLVLTTNQQMTVKWSYLSIIAPFSLTLPDGQELCCFESLTQLFQLSSFKKRLK